MFGVKLVCLLIIVSSGGYIMKMKMTMNCRVCIYLTVGHLIKTPASIALAHSCVLSMCHCVHKHPLSIEALIHLCCNSLFGLPHSSGPYPHNAPVYYLVYTVSERYSPAGVLEGTLYDEHARTILYTGVLHSGQITQALDRNKCPL